MQDNAIVRGGVRSEPIQVRYRDQFHQIVDIGWKLGGP